MAEGIIRGMLANGFEPGQISVFDVIAERTKTLAERYGISGCSTTEECVRSADLIVFAVKPQVAESVAAQVKPFLGQDDVFVSICAGVKTESYKSWLPEGQKIVRVMPNTLTETGHGFSAVHFCEEVDEEDKAAVMSMLEANGRVVEIPESMFDSFTAYSCTGPAYILYFMNAMIDAGVRCGFSRRDSREMTIENLIGTAVKTEKTGKHPFEILDTMTSPAGVTIEAVSTMAQDNFYGAVMHSIADADRRSKELG